MNKLISIILLFSLPLRDLNAQNIMPIATDRPDQTECPFIVPKGYFQAENGLSYEKTTTKSHSWAAPSILWKYGVSDNIELRLITEHCSEIENKQIIRGIKPVTVGFKVKISEEKGILPKTSFIGHLALPRLATKEMKALYYAPSFRFTMQHTLFDKLSLAYNLGAEWDGATPQPTFIYTLTTGFGITERLGSYIEIYGFAPQNQQTDHRFDGGFTYLLNENIMFDISSGFGLTHNAPKSFVSLGFSYRFDAKFKNKN